LHCGFVPWPQQDKQFYELHGKKPHELFFFCKTDAMSAARDAANSGGNLVRVAQFAELGSIYIYVDAL